MREGGLACYRLCRLSAGRKEWGGVETGRVGEGD